MNHQDCNDRNDMYLLDILEIKAFRSSLRFLI